MVSVVRRSRIAAYILVPLVLSAAGAAFAAPDKTQAADKEQHVNPNKRVCHNVQITGSLMHQRVCMKQRKWDELREEAQQLLQDQNQAVQSSDGSAGG